MFCLLEGQCLSNLEQLQKENHETLENYKVETRASIKSCIPNLRSNLIQHAQVVVGLFDVNLVNFRCMRKLTNLDLYFDVLNPSSEDWENFLKEWRESCKLFYSQDPWLTSPTLTKRIDPEEEVPKNATTTTTPNEEEN